VQALAKELLARREIGYRKARRIIGDAIYKVGVRNVT
jgi:hypothetical protein